MPLPAPAKRKKLHNRQVLCEGFEREDGLYDIEGRMVDTKTYSFDNQDRGGQIEAGEALHDMKIRLTLDLDFRIHQVEAVTDASPYNICPSIAGVMKKLEGKQIGPGWTRMTKELFAGAGGCTHLTELLGPIATTAFQTMAKARSQRSEKAGKTSSVARHIINSCHALAEDGEVVRRSWPDFYKPNAESEAS
jgi:hypothetical protein